MARILPAVLRALRKNKKLSQAKLAKATRGHNKVGVATIKRIEAFDGIYEARQRVAVGLAQALHVSVEALAKEPQEDDRQYPYWSWNLRAVSAVVDDDTALAFDMVERLYGISPERQIDMAPLLAALMAEGSLAWRREKLAAIDEATEKLRSIGDDAGHLCFVNAVWRTENGAHGEREAIEKRDLFGRCISDEAYELGYDPDMNNPFVDYLRAFAEQVEVDDIHIDPESCTDLPKYAVGGKVVGELTGYNGLARYALSGGHAKIGDIPENLLGDDKKEERIAWMVSRIPEDEHREVEEREAEWNAFSERFRLAARSESS